MPASHRAPLFRLNAAAPTTFRFPWSCCHHRLAAAWALVVLTAVCGCVSDPFRAATLSTAAVMLPQETEVIPAAIIPAGEMPAAEASSGVVQASYESDILLEATAVDAALPDPDTDALTLNDCIRIAMRRQPRLQVELENVTRASLAGDISSAAFLPLVSAGYSVGEFGVNVGGIGIPIPGAPAAQGTYVPQQGFLPIGFDYYTTLCAHRGPHPVADHRLRPQAWRAPAGRPRRGNQPAEVGEGPADRGPRGHARLLRAAAGRVAL